MRFASAVVAFACAGAALSASAQENAAPLAGAKQQLNALKQDARAQENSERLGDSLRGAVPQVSAPSLAPVEAARPPKRTDAERESERNSAGPRNWLLDGYDKLSPTKSGSGRRSTASEAEESRPLDPKDPDYFLRLYERQRTKAQAAVEQEQKTPEGTGDAGKIDAMAPFMQSWLAGSPVKTALADVLREGGSASNVPDAPQQTRGDSGWLGGRLSGGPRAEDAAAGRATRGTVESLAPAANPYLQALNLSADPRVPREANAPAVSVPPPAPLTQASPVEVLPKTPPKPPAVFSPPPSPRDEQKYFPQLKKF